ncbi:tripartite motif-containing protein 2-like [Branchiostoma floridae x Branchiostoma belcheri]
MASKLASDDFDEQFLTCAVCMLHYRDARILPCLHTFCKQCLQEWAAKQQPLECPTCRKPVSLPDQGVDGLKINFYVSNLLEFAAVKKGAEPGVPCQVCERNVEGSKSWCADCATLMCESCTAVHRKLPATKDHEVTTEETLRAQGGVSNFQRKRYCQKHKSQELVFYCETCNALVCTACTVVDHRPGKDHNPVEITSVAQTKKETLQGLLQDIDPRLRKIEASIEDVDKKMSKVIHSKDAATKQTNTYFRQLVDILQKRKEQILSRIEEQCQVDSKGLQAKKEAIEFALAELTSAQTFCQQTVEHGSDVHIVEVGNQVQTRVETLLAKELDLESNWSEFQFIESTSLVEFEREIENFGGLETNVDVDRCKVVVKPAVEGFRCVAELTTMDQKGSLCDTNSKAVTANMKDPSGTEVPTQLQIKSRGVWEMSYVPKVTGKHRLEVKVNSQQVAGSPFDVQVQEGDTPVLTIGRKDSGVGELDGPVGVAVDKDGNIVVVEQGGRRVQTFDADRGQALSSFPVDGGYPFGIDVDSNGTLLVTSDGEDCGIRRYSKEGELLSTLKPDCVQNPSGVAVLKDGRMVVADIGQTSCLLLQPDGSLIREIGKGQLQVPWCIAVDESRDVMFVTDQSAHKVLAFGLDGNLMFSFGEEGQNDGELNCPSGITVDPVGNIIVANFDGDDGRVQVFGPDGTFIRMVATVKLGDAVFGLALTPDGNIAVACADGHCVELYRYM